LYHARYDLRGQDRRVNFQHCATFNRYVDDSYKTTAKILTMFLEMYFVLMRVHFVAWFFGQVLTKKFLGQTVNWGPDLVWCSAAHMFNGMHGPESLSPSSLVFVHILDNDTKQLRKGPSIVTFTSKVMWLWIGFKAIQLSIIG